MEFPAAVAQKKVPLLYGPVLLGSYSLSRTEVPEKDRLVVQELPECWEHCRKTARFPADPSLKEHPVPFPLGIPKGK